MSDDQRNVHRSRKTLNENVMHYYLGIDGGGTSTTVAVANASSKILGTGTAGPSLYKVVGVKNAVGNIRKAILTAEKKACVKSPSYAYAVLGLSGVDSMKDWKTLSALVYKNFKPRLGDRFRVVNDVVIALATGTKKKYGIALIAGTGSNAYAVGPSGEAYASGLGSLLADEGSANWIGCHILRAAVKSFDGRGQKTMLEQLLCTTLKVRTMRDAVDKVYQNSFDKTTMAALAPLCTLAARCGDAVARRVMYQAAQELADMVVAVAKRAGLAQGHFDCVLSGGVWKAGKILYTPFVHAVRQYVSPIRFVPLNISPVQGALRLAIHHDSIE